MSADFKFDKHAMDKIAQDVVKETIRKAQPEFDRLCREYKGKPVQEVKPRVAALLHKLGWEAERGDIDAYAKVISNGQPIKLR